MKDFLVDSLKNLDSYNKILKNVQKDISPIASYGIVDESLGHIVYGINKHLGRQTLLITHNDRKAQRLYEDIKNLGNSKVEFFPKKEVFFYDVNASSHENLIQRLNVMSQLINEKGTVVVASIEAILDKVINKDIFTKHIQKIKFGEDVDLDSLVNTLTLGGYERVSMVEGVGQFSLRGGIIDIFPPDSQNPYRIELFDEEVDSIRSFDIVTQRSIEVIDNVTIIPVKDILITEDYRDKTIQNLKQEIEKQNPQVETRRKFNRYIELLEDTSPDTNSDMILPYIPNKYLGSILDYFKDDSIVFVNESRRIKESFQDLEEGLQLQLTDLLEAGEILPSHFNMNYEYKELVPEIKRKTVITNSSLLGDDRNFPPKAIQSFAVKSTTNYHNKIDLLAEDIEDYKYRGYKIIILAGTEERGLRLQKSLREFQVESSFSKDRAEEIKSGQLFITTGSVQDGFEYSDIKLMVISDREIFGVQKKKRRSVKKSKGENIVDLADLDVGSYIVHENHGIGRYEGMEQLDIQGVKKDYLTIRYRNTDKLFIPIDQMDLIQKYVGSDDAKPRLNRLNSGEWQRTKARAQKAVEDMAEDLLNLYAKREKYEGYSFSEDGVWQREFEDLFPYEETEGQIQSAMEIKEDMEKPKPMDRLLCGDVGYGKTEVALRAAFKALMDGKQVAILVPTTILAQQHYNTIVDRFSEFPINPALLSRFRTSKEQEDTIEGLRNGTVDIVVGTHRLVSKDVNFKDLGLLIIDEEQRFGVKHKETIKTLREDVDVLTLTATPIPRTLHMSLVGIRDMSVIEEPPENRYPIQTYVVEYNEQMIRDAILKEINRGGQVYFVYNRVATIDRMALRLQELVPEANFTVAHGQMGERQLEKVMVDFLNKEQDVLVCTTIIETGLDISNVNTIIIHNADKMGLAQLYQLRGRVGRTNRLAYGYFTYERDKVLTEVAEKRLRAIKEFTEFGSGFKIAMRDLEIRGAGNLLGVKQHGHIEAIGYDLYVKFLGNAINKLKGEKTVQKIDTTIEIRVDGYIPTGFIKNEELKIEVYKKIAAIDSMENYSELLDELIDRFGDVPQQVMNLMDISYIKALASRNQIKNINQLEEEVRLDFVSNEDIPVELVYDLFEQYGDSINFDLSFKPHLSYRCKDDALSSLKKLLENIDNFFSETIKVESSEEKIS